MGIQLMERWLRTAAPLVPREGRYWVHADPKLFPTSKRQFWRQLRSLDRDWERKRTHVHGRMATIVRPRNGTMGLRIGFLLCHSEFRRLFEACASELKRQDRVDSACASRDGTMGSIQNNTKEKESIDNIPKILFRKKSSGESKPEKLSGDKLMSSVKDVVKQREDMRKAKLAEENRTHLIETSRTVQQLGMLWRVLYSERFGYAHNLSGKQAGNAKTWSEEFRLDFKAPIGLLWNDVFANWDAVRARACKESGWSTKEAPEKPRMEWMFYNRDAVTQWWVDLHTDGASTGGTDNIGKNTL